MNLKGKRVACVMCGRDTNHVHAVCSHCRMPPQPLEDFGYHQFHYLPMGNEDDYSEDSNPKFARFEMSSGGFFRWIRTGRLSRYYYEGT
jgi:hypothetical protein